LAKNAGIGVSTGRANPPEKSTEFTGAEALWDEL
jgi:hypothetical protein